MQESSPIDLRVFQLTYDVAEDRLKFVIGGADDDQSTCLWLTRRLIQKIWPILIDVLQPCIKEAPSDLLREIGENQLSETHVEKRFEYRDAQAPKLTFLGNEKNCLVAKVEVKVEEANSMSVTLVDLREQGIKISLTAELLLTLCKIVAQSIEMSEWNLDLKHSHLFSNFSDEALQTGAQPVKIKQSTRLN